MSENYHLSDVLYLFIFNQGERLAEVCRISYRKVCNAVFLA